MKIIGAWHYKSLMSLEDLVPDMAMKQGQRVKVMFISIIVPVYNGEGTIQQCLNALVDQEGLQIGKDYEIILVDDGSTDNTVEIAQKYPVRIVKLAKNSGRIFARKEGALQAKSNTLFFVDSRVIVAKNVLSTFIKIGYMPTICGDYSEKENKYKNVFYTIFYLIRKRYYGEYFPQKNEQIWIDKKNFLRAPKGTGALFISKEVFLDILPDRYSRTTSDDTLLFEKLVVEKNIYLLRNSKLKVTYLQRSAIKVLIPWLFYRGVLFTDFYMTPGGRYFPLFILCTLINIAMISFIFVFYEWLLFFIAGILCIFILICLFIKENARDFIILLWGLPFVSFIFGGGIYYYYAKKILSKK